MILCILLNTKKKKLIMKQTFISCEPRVDNNTNNSEICEPIMFVNDTKVDATYYYLVNILEREELPNVKICTKIRNNCILCGVTNVLCLQFKLYPHPAPPCPTIDLSQKKEEQCLKHQVIILCNDYVQYWSSHMSYYKRITSAH